MVSKDKAKISIIIPVHFGGTNFHRCLRSLAASMPAPEEIIVVADGDTDGAWRFAQDSGAQVLRIPTPGGPARARNLGAHTAKGDILFFVDADVAIPPDAMSQIIAAFQHDSDLAAVFGSYDDEPFETNFLSQYKNLFHHYVHQTAEEEASTFWGACGAIRREVFLAMGGFDEAYRRPSIEDIDLGYRLRRAGYRIRLLKDLQVKHLKRWGVGSLLKADIFNRALPWTTLILREGKILNDLNLTTSYRASGILACLFLLTVSFIPYIPWLRIPAILIPATLLVLNQDLYLFFLNKRGLPFALKVIPWHWFYYLYGGFAFMAAFLKFRLKG
jgi:GT2 family glycosyltransferase